MMGLDDLLLRGSPQNPEGNINEPLVYQALPSNHPKNGHFSKKTKKNQKINREIRNRSPVSVSNFEGTLSTRLSAFFNPRRFQIIMVCCHLCRGEKSFWPCHTFIPQQEGFIIMGPYCLRATPSTWRLLWFSYSCTFSGFQSEECSNHILHLFSGTKSINRPYRSSSRFSLRSLVFVSPNGTGWNFSSVCCPWETLFKDATPIAAFRGRFDQKQTFNTLKQWLSPKKNHTNFHDLVSDHLISILRIHIVIIYSKLFLGAAIHICGVCQRWQLAVEFDNFTLVAQLSRACSCHNFDSNVCGHPMGNHGWRFLVLCADNDGQ